MPTSDRDPIVDLYTDLSACLMAIRNLLMSKGLVTHDEFVQAFQERALSLLGAQSGAPLLLLNGVARGQMPREIDPGS